MRNTIKSLTIYALSFCGTAFATSTTAELEQKVNTLAKTLKGELLSAMKEGGPSKALDACHIKAMPLTKGMNDEKIEVGRSSLKIRNPINKPEDWIKPYLMTAEKSKVKGQYVDLPGGKKAYIKPLYIEQPCLVCHGENLAPNIKSLLDRKYPEDQARGYKVGDFRGFIWAKEI